MQLATNPTRGQAMNQTESPETLSLQDNDEGEVLGDDFPESRLTRRQTQIQVRVQIRVQIRVHKHNKSITQ